jgi:class 3 adenylate cyclase/tetratricopeptide (TPR) repeat protein
MSSVREERKVVSVLFCDLVGFTSRSEDADPEDVAAVLRGYHGHVGSELERFGGTVEKFIGDAVMALFGAPLAHEDDPERAVRAALAIRDWAEEAGELEVRIGITTGEALVSLDARPESGQGMASGDVVNTAARLQAAAEENGILVDATTYRATERAIVFEEAEPVVAKGKREPVPVYRAVETRARYGVDIAADVETPLVGREREVDLLLDALARARNEREPQLVTLVGVPGIGKSRLVYELSRAVDEDEELIAWRQGRSLPYGEGVTFWSLGEMAKAQAGILESDSAEVASEKLEHAVRSFLPEAAEADWVVRQLRPLVGLAAGDELVGDRRTEAFAAWRRFFEAVAEESPLVLVFEDLQWADDGVLDFIDHLMEWSSSLPLLIVATARPELIERRPGWGGGTLNAATTQVGALSENDTARLLAALLEQAVLPAETQSTLLARAGGNPLYAQEFVRMLSDRGLLLRREGGALALETNGDLPLPESIQGIIAARLDVLSLDEKEVLQDASVLGKVVWTGALETISQRSRSSVEECLHSLRRKDFLRHERRSAVAGETQFTFLHLLTRDVAYGQIPRANRADKHRRAAEWLESMPADRAEDRAEMIAYHYLSALDLARSAGQETAELAERARLALGEAGDRAFALNAFRPAVQFYEEALGLTPEDDPQRPRLLYRLVTTRVHGGGVEPGDYETATEALLAAGERELAAEAAVLAGVTETNRGNQDVVWAKIDQAQELIEDAPPSRSKAFVLQWIALTYSLAGRSDEALEAGRAALAIAEELGFDDIRANALSTIGITRFAMGDAGGVDDQRRSIEVARASNSVDVIRSLGNLASCQLDLGQIARACETLAQAAVEAQRFGSVWGRDWLGPEQVTHLYYEGAWDAALLGVDELERELEHGLVTFMEGPNRTVRARIRVARGDVDGALADTRRSRDLARLAKNPQLLHMSLASFAAVHAQLGLVDEASAAVDELFADWRAHPVLASAFWLLDLAYALVPLGRAGELDVVLAALRMQTPWGDAARAYAVGDLPGAAAVLDSMEAVPEAAYVRLKSGLEPEVRRALEFYRSVAAARYVAEGEAMLATSRSA